MRVLATRLCLPDTNGVYENLMECYILMLLDYVPFIIALNDVG